MKKIVGLALFVLILVFPWAAHAKSNFMDASTGSATGPKQHEDMKKKIEEKKKELNGSEWKVDMTSGAKKEAEDILTFQNQQVKSKFFSDKGFPASNYTVSLPEGSDTATWETMQTDPKGGVVFMRGEWKEKTMRGVVSEQLEEGKTRDHNFASTTVETIPASTEKPKEEEVAPPTQPEPPTLVSDKAPEASADVAEVAPFDPGTTDEIPSGTGSKSDRYR